MTRAELKLLAKQMQEAFTALSEFTDNFVNSVDAGGPTPTRKRAMTADDRRIWRELDEKAQTLRTRFMNFVQSGELFEKDDE